ncbi:MULTISPECIES: hypothetical protein [unclassified Halomonas]|uniref:hypothetical protein n=1 Tax=unclassified Halomonas TaxID=2609666 RepID=UPI002076B9DD|nr:MULTISPECIES: hypothetical protein [unclassified Halomonas]
MPDTRLITTAFSFASPFKGGLNLNEQFTCQPIISAQAVPGEQKLQNAKKYSQKKKINSHSAILRCLALGSYAWTTEPVSLYLSSNEQPNTLN